MYALDVETGEQRWYTPAQNVCNDRDFCQPGLSAPASVFPGGVLAGAMDGHVRAYRAKDGAVAWDLDSAISFKTVNGVEAMGGSFGGGTGPIFKGRRLFMNSGYGIYFHMPGNVLLVYELEE